MNVSIIHVGGREEKYHLREPNQDDTVHDALEHDEPLQPELAEPIILDEAGSTQQSEASDEQHDQHAERDKEAHSRQEKVCALDGGLVAHAFYTGDTDDLRRLGERIVVTPRDDITSALDLGESVGGGTAREVFRCLERALRDLHRDRLLLSKQIRRLALGGLDVPVKDPLHEVDVDDADGPVVVLHPGGGERGEGHGHHGDHGLGLEVAEDG